MTNQLDQRIINAGFAAVEDRNVFGSQDTNIEAFQRLSVEDQFKKAKELGDARIEAAHRFYDAAVKLCRTEEEITLLRQYVQQLANVHCGAKKPSRRICR